MKIKILTGHSEKGGSTFALINLTNKLNNLGYDTTLYGPHSWHLGKCKSEMLNNNLKIENEDRLIVHYLKLPKRPPAKKVILSCHEKNLYEVGKINKFWDEVIFLNEKHKNYHSDYKGPFRILPNIREELQKKQKSLESEKNAGIIGSIDPNKQTHLSIKRALEMGYEKVYLFGAVNNPHYFQSQVQPLMSEKVILHGFESNKQKMYDMIGAAFLSSISEVASLVEDECDSTGTKFFGNNATEHDTKIMTNDEIISEWIKILS